MALRDFLLNIPSCFVMVRIITMCQKIYLPDSCLHSYGGVSFSLIFTFGWYFAQALRMSFSKGIYISRSTTPPDYSELSKRF